MIDFQMCNPAEQFYFSFSQTLDTTVLYNRGQSQPGGDKNASSGFIYCNKHSWNWLKLLLKKYIYGVSQHSHMFLLFVENKIWLITTLGKYFVYRISNGVYLQLLNHNYSFNNHVEQCPTSIWWPMLANSPVMLHLHLSKSSHTSAEFTLVHFY